MRRGAQLAAILSVLLLAIGAAAMAGVATAQDDGATTDQTDTDGTTDDEGVTTEEDLEESEEPEIPPGFTEDECDFTEREDGTTVVTCRHERQAEFRAEAAARREVLVEPVGGTAAGAGGLAGSDGSVIPMLIGIGGLALAGTAVFLARRRRLD
jgi:hypothetical protein